MLPIYLSALLALSQPEPPIVMVTADDTPITQSCTLRIAPDTVIPDANNNGVLHIAADNITITFEDGSTLRGAPNSTFPDQLTGTGLTLDNHKAVTIESARITGYKVAIRATRCDHLTIAHADLSGNYRQRLKSTPKAEDSSDWLWPHQNDADEWTTNYGAALSIKNAKGITLRDITVRRGQNGIILDRVTDSRIYDNDCSFLSGWGLALWRSSRNTITRNALDFCVRGYSHNIYNRGQDSAGLLIFEQCDENVIAHNSITHGGDGIFGFGGREAIGESPAPSPDFDYTRRGNRGNLIANNDLSYAAAHGLEMTFSFDQSIFRNRLVGNAICGIWGGYSQGFLIAGNIIENNGGMAYGLERGGINMEHASGNRILNNRFRNNKCGVHLWWDNDAALLEKPGVKHNYQGVTGNTIASNTFDGDTLGIQVRDASQDKSRADDNMILGNLFTDVPQSTAIDEGLAVDIDGPIPEPSLPEVQTLGKKSPVGARRHLAGRESIVMTEWGPWDHAGPFVRLVEDRGGSHLYEFFNVSAAHTSTSGVGLTVGHEGTGDNTPNRWTLTISAAGPGAALYRTRINAPGFKHELSGALLKVRWDLSFFPWDSIAAEGPSPPADLDAWRALATGDRAVRATSDSLHFPFGSRGPSQLAISAEVTAAAFKPDYFGLIAESAIPLTRGEWKVTTTSDDGVRILADGQPLIENWTHHSASEDSATLTIEHDRTVHFTVEYFEIYGAATLDLRLERTGD